MALHTWLWVVRDVSVLGAGTLWDVWTGAVLLGTESAVELPATTLSDVGLGVLQLAAVFAALTGAWTAGGLLASTTALTFAVRLPVIWHVVLHTESSPYFVDKTFDVEGTGSAAALTSAFVVLLCLVLGVVLLAGLRPWTHTPATPPGTPGQVPPFGAPQHGMQPGVPQPFAAPEPPEPPLPSESPQRPVGAHVAVALAFFGLLDLFAVGWAVYMFTELSVDSWLGLFIGRFGLNAALAAGPGWSWLTAVVLCTAGGVVTLMRGYSARGFSMGYALSVVPPTLLGLLGMLASGSLTGDSPLHGVTFVTIGQNLLTLLAGAAVLALAMRPGIPADPAAAALSPGGPVPLGGPMPPQGGPGPYMPGAPVHGGPVPGGQMPGGQMPGGPVPGAPMQPYMPGGAPMQQGMPPQQPAPPAGAQGAFGPPPQNQPYAPPQQGGPPQGAVPGQPVPPQPAGPPPGAPPQPSAPPQQGGAGSGAPVPPPPPGAAPGYGYPPPPANPPQATGDPNAGAPAGNGVEGSGTGAGNAKDAEDAGGSPGTPPAQA